jgi:hypothetical protein
LLDALDLPKNLAGDPDDDLAGWGHSRQVLTAAGKDLDPQLVLEQAYLLRNAGLRGIEALCGCRYVKVVVCDLPDVPKLLELHIA